MTFEWFVSLRYLRAKRKQKFISLISIISVLGVAVGVLALIVVLSVYTGFTEGLRDQIIGVNAHALIQRFGGTISNPEKVIQDIHTVKGVEAASPYIYGQALISSGRNSSGIVLRGIDPETAGKVIAIDREMKTGSLLDLKKNDGLPAIILGVELAQQLRVQVGDKIRLISPNGPLSPMGILPKVLTCQVGGIFETGMYEYDSTMGYVNLETAPSPYRP